MRQSSGTQSSSDTALPEPRSFAEVVLRWTLRRVLGFLQRPLTAIVLFEGLLILWLLPPVMFRAMLDWRLYAVMNASMVIDGLLFWFLVLDPRPAPPAPVSFPARLSLSFLIIFPQIMVGTALGMAQHDLYPSFALCGRVYAGISPLLDQQIGGLILWVPSGMMSALAAVLIMARMFRHEDAASSLSPSLRSIGIPTARDQQMLAENSSERSVPAAVPLFHKAHQAHAR
jgi:putative membrane protein